MAEVEKTIQHTLGIKLQTIDNSLKDIEEIVSNVVKMKFNELSTREEFDTTIDHVVKGLEATYSKLMQDYIGNIRSSEQRLNETAKTIHGSLKNKSKNMPDLSSNDVEQKDNIDNSIIKKKRKNKSKGFWTTDMKQQFLRDFNKRSTEFMMESYGFDTEKQLKKRYYNYRYELKAAGLLID